MRREAWMGETMILDDTARRSAGGSFLQLTHGYTHYQTTDTVHSRPIVLVHGFSAPFQIWEPTFRALADAGMYAIRYDLYGRGFSDRPPVAYDLSLFLVQLRQLLETLGHAQADLVGLSMGGPIAAAFSVSFPERVRRLVLIDPSGAGSVARSYLYKIAALPGISDLLFSIAETEFMWISLAPRFFGENLVHEVRECYQTQMQYQGYKRAICSTVSHNMLGNFITTYTQVGKIGKPVLLIWGENDRTVPFRQSKTLRRLLPHAEFLAVPQCGHAPHYERPDIVQPRLIDFLS